MENFIFNNPAKIVFGRDTVGGVAELCKEYGSRVLIVHYGGDFLKMVKVEDELLKSFSDAGVFFTEFGGVVANPTYKIVLEGIKLCKKENIDFVLAVGGGSSIDTAKSIAAGAYLDCDLWDCFEGKVKGDFSKTLPVGVILTIPAAGSESSPAAVLTNEENMKKRLISSPFIIPKFAILNPEYTYSLPAYQTASGAADIIAHLLERYFTQAEGVDLSDRLLEGALKTMLYTTPAVLKNPSDYAGRAEMMWTGTMAHNGILGAGRIEDWGSHEIEHELSGIYNIAHGAGMAIVFPAWMKHVYKEKPSRFVQFAVRVMDVDMAFSDEEGIILEGIRRFEDFLTSINMPTRLSHANIDNSRISEMAKKTVGDGRGTVGFFKPLTEQDCLAILKLAL